MEIKVILRHLRISPRKAREVVDLVRGKNAAEAKTALEFAVKRASAPVLKLLNSAVASAKHDFQIDESNLFVSKITVDEGPTLKRWHAMSRGRAYPIMKRSSHITLVLGEINPTEKKETKTEKIKEVKAVKKLKKQQKKVKKT
ncbi:MAG: 50S ribosomal protein L22 [Patescibacteria group bacterium]